MHHGRLIRVTLSASHAAPLHRQADSPVVEQPVVGEAVGVGVRIDRQLAHIPDGAVQRRHLLLGGGPLAGQQRGGQAGRRWPRGAALAGTPHGSCAGAAVGQLNMPRLHSGGVRGPRARGGAAQDHRLPSPNRQCRLCTANVCFPPAPRGWSWQAVRGGCGPGTAPHLPPSCPRLH